VAGVGTRSGATQSGIADVCDPVDSLALCGLGFAGFGRFYRLVRRGGRRGVQRGDRPADRVAVGGAVMAIV